MMQTVLAQSDRPPRSLDGDSQIVVDRRGAAVWLLLNRTECANAYTAEMLDTLEREVSACDADRDIRAIVITGAGERSFCAGADRNDLAERDWRSVLTLASARVFERIRQSRCVTIAAINGAAVGGGLELALSCDLRLAADTARFWLPEPELGLIPAAGGLELLPQLVGSLRAKEMILGGAQWSAEEALRYGLITEITAANNFSERIQPWIDRIAIRDIDAIQFCKQALNQASHRSTGATSDLLAQALLVLRNRTESP